MRIKVKEYYEKLEQAVTTMIESKNVKEYLNKMRLFRRYSFANTILMLMQKPNVTRVAGIGTWNKLGRRVKKGEKGIMIFAPMFSKWKSKDKDPDEKTVEENDSPYNKSGSGARLVGFKIVHVYDISQTYGQELSCEELEASSAFSLAAGTDVKDLTRVILNTCPCPVRYDNIEGITRGYYNFGNDEIVISDRLTDVEIPKTLIHELAHRVALSTCEHTMAPDDRPMSEVIAEGAAFIVCGYYGLDTGSYSFPYIIKWGQDTQKIVSWGKAVMKVANQIIDLIEVRADHLRKAA